MPADLAAEAKKEAIHLSLKKGVGAISEIHRAAPSEGYQFFVGSYNSKKLKLEASKRVPVRVNRNVYGYDSRGWALGHCTSYVAERYDLTHADGWRGNGGQWLDTAERLGKEITSEPKPGDIIVTNESEYGHVAIVEDVTADGVIISEMNYKGHGVVSDRQLAKDAPQVKGYIPM